MNELEGNGVGDAIDGTQQRRSSTAAAITMRRRKCELWNEMKKKARVSRTCFAQN